MSPALERHNTFAGGWEAIMSIHQNTQAPIRPFLLPYYFAVWAPITRDKDRRGGDDCAIAHFTASVVGKWGTLQQLAPSSQCQWRMLDFRAFLYSWLAVSSWRLHLSILQPPPWVPGWNPIDCVAEVKGIQIVHKSFRGVSLITIEGTQHTSCHMDSKIYLMPWSLQMFHEVVHERWKGSKGNIYVCLCKQPHHTVNKTSETAWKSPCWSAGVTKHSHIFFMKTGQQQYGHQHAMGAYWS